MDLSSPAAVAAVDPDTLDEVDASDSDDDGADRDGGSESSDEDELDCVSNDDMTAPPDNVVSDPSAAPAPAPAGTSAPGAAAAGGGASAAPSATSRSSSTPAAGAAAAAAPKQRRTVSVADADYRAKRLVYLHVDVEVHGGSDAGLLQLSGTARDFSGAQLGDDFDEYVKPKPDARWNMHEDALCHGLLPNDRRLTSADPVTKVWPRFVAWAEAKVGAEGGGKVGCFVWWNGVSCDLECMHKIVDIEHYEELRWPANIPYSFDPCAITYLKGCAWHKHCHEDDHGAGLESVYEHVFQRPLKNAHSSIADCRGQAAVCLQPDPDAKDATLMDFANKPNGIQLISELLAAKRNRVANVRKETKRPLPLGWTENGPGRGAEVPGMQYDLGEGGPASGPTSAAADAAADPVQLFLSFLPVQSEPTRGGVVSTSLEQIAAESNAYAQEIVKPVKYGTGAKKKTIFVKCDATDPDARRRFSRDDDADWQSFSAFSILAFLAILIFAAVCGVRDVLMFWSKPGHSKGLNVPWVQNSMPRDTFLLHRRFLHFVDNSRLPGVGARGREPLQKIRAVISHFSRKFKQMWRLGKKVAADEGMIRYTGRAIPQIRQYMPNKPIKVGIKVYCLCDSPEDDDVQKGYMFSFEIFTGSAPFIDSAGRTSV